MSFGIPVIARDIPGNQFIVHGKTGLLYQQPQEFTKNLKLLFENKSRWSEISRASQEFVKANHNANIEEIFYKEIMETLIAKTINIAKK